MHKIDLAIYPVGFFSLRDLIPLPTDYSTRQALTNLGLAEINLVEWRGKLTPQQILTWELRDRRKKYKVKLILSVAVALQITLQSLTIDSHLQEVLDELNRALVNAGLSPKKLLTVDVYD